MNKNEEQVMAIIEGDKILLDRLKPLADFMNKNLAEGVDKVSAQELKNYLKLEDFVHIKEVLELVGWATGDPNPDTIVRGFIEHQGGK